jgi:hypothetical protein
VRALQVRLVMLTLQYVVRLVPELFLAILLTIIHRLRRECRGAANAGGIGQARYILSDSSKLDSHSRSMLGGGTCTTSEHGVEQIIRATAFRA